MLTTTTPYSCSHIITAPSSSPSLRLLLLHLNYSSDVPQALLNETNGVKQSFEENRSASTGLLQYWPTGLLANRLLTMPLVLITSPTLIMSLTLTGIIMPHTHTYDVLYTL
jgi:hypothetical protein